MKNVAIIGAGVTGVTTAYSLAKRGANVTVFDSHRYPAMETSYANGGQLSASNSEVWNSWKTISKGARWMLNASAPLLLNPKPSWHKYSWLAEFIGSIRHYRSNTIATTQLALSARQHLLRIMREERIDCDYNQNGILHIYRTSAEFKEAVVVNDLLVKGGLERHPIDRAEIQRLCPGLRSEFSGGFFTPGDATGDIHKFTTGLANACRRRGVTFQLASTVRNIEILGQRFLLAWEDGGDSAETRQSFDAVVVCAGTESRSFARMLGDRVNIYPVKGYSITVNLEDETSRQAVPTFGLLDESAKIVTSRLGTDRFRVAGTAEFSGVNRDIRSDRVAPLIRWVNELFPPVVTRSVTPWCGLRPMTPSMMPRVGAGRRTGVYYNTGHGHLGWTLSAATAEMISEQVCAGFH